jgi:hypothetical protein
MDRNEVRYRIISTLLQAGGPLTLPELVAGAEVAEAELFPVLRELVNQTLVVEGELLPERPAPQYCWGARWEAAAQRRATVAQQEIRTAVEPAEKVSEVRLDVESAPARAFHDHVINEYHPPGDKRFLVFFQCSVRRPFSKSPSHASMRRAIRVATGYDPRKGFEGCPVHVVVLASKIGPVPYELEDVYPANVRGGGVKHFETRRYDCVKPILAERIAAYILTHGNNYERVTTFTEGRYAEVMQAAREIVVARRGEEAYFPILPQIGGPRVVRMGESTPHTYWAQYWIQLYLEVVDWLEPDQQALAQARLQQLKVTYRGKWSPGSRHGI